MCIEIFMTIPIATYSRLRNIDHCSKTPKFSNRIPYKFGI